MVKQKLVVHTNFQSVSICCFWKLQRLQEIATFFVFNTLLLADKVLYFYTDKNYDVKQLKICIMMEIIAYCLGGLTIIVFIAFIIAWACMQEEQFDEINKKIEEIKKSK